MTSDDTAYYRQRAVDERAMAKASTNERVAEIHEDLARQYQALAEHADLRPGPGDYVLPARVADDSRWHHDWKGCPEARTNGVSRPR